MKELLSRYTRYNLWANKKTAGFLSALPPHLLEKEMPSSFPTLQKTFYHIWNAEYIWLNRLQGVPFDTLPGNSFQGSFGEGVKEVLAGSEAFHVFAEAQQEAFFGTAVVYSSLDGREYSTLAADVILHCMNHSTFHRGQLVTMLRNAGFTDLSATDYTAFCRS
jgi:uncharacterized damage-inducible protein DinB